MQSIGTFETARLAFPFVPGVLRALIPDGVVGTYLLLREGAPVYVGRSDTCLRRRLASHNHIGRATHVSWEVCRSATNAYVTEAHWFHRLAEVPGHHPLNSVHPALPAGSAMACPFCPPKEREALARAIPHLA
jgi:hypothetical protein